VRNGLRVDAQYQHHFLEKGRGGISIQSVPNAVTSGLKCFRLLFCKSYKTERSVALKTLKTRVLRA
jgi:hypothetical protein